LRVQYIFGIGVVRARERDRNRVASAVAHNSAMDGGQFFDHVEHLLPLLCRMRGTPFPAASREFCAQRVESLGPEMPERLQPLIDSLQRTGFDGVQTTGALGSDPSEAVLPEHPQVLRQPAG
jgi:hypothetical protein